MQQQLVALKVHSDWAHRASKMVLSGGIGAKTTKSHAGFSFNEPAKIIDVGRSDDLPIIEESTITICCRACFVLIVRVNKSLGIRNQNCG